MVRICRTNAAEKRGPAARKQSASPIPQVDQEVFVLEVKRNCLILMDGTTAGELSSPEAKTALPSFSTFLKTSRTLTLKRMFLMPRVSLPSLINIAPSLVIPDSKSVLGSNIVLYQNRHPDAIVSRGDQILGRQARAARNDEVERVFPFGTGHSRAVSSRRATQFAGIAPAFHRFFDDPVFDQSHGCASHSLVVEGTAALQAVIHVIPDSDILAQNRFTDFARENGSFLTVRVACQIVPEVADEVQSRLRFENDGVDPASRRSGRGFARLFSPLL